MNALLNHEWGKSPAQDRVWAQVTGLAPNRAVRRLLMVLNFQAFIDDSYTPKGEFVLGGHIAAADKWAEFSKGWEALLPSGTLTNDDAYHFKMSEMALTAHRMERVPAFYWLIEKFVRLSVSIRMNLSEFGSAIQRVKEITLARNWHIDFGRWENPYFFAFRGLIDEFHKSRTDVESVIPLTEKVDFYFDNQMGEKGFILEAWDGYLKQQAENTDLLQYYGATPRFEDDRDFLPLQAADLWAWWVRKWYEEDAIEMPDKMRELDFGKWRGKKRSMAAFSYGEQQIVDRLMEVALQNIHLARRTSDGEFIMQRAGPGCLNRFSASISGASTKVRLPSGGAAA